MLSFVVYYCMLYFVFLNVVYWCCMGCGDDWCSVLCVFGCCCMDVFVVCNVLFVERDSICDVDCPLSVCCVQLLIMRWALFMLCV